MRSRSRRIPGGVQRRGAGERRAHHGDRLLETGVVQRQHVGVALDSDHAALRGGGPARVIGGKDLFALVEDGAV